MNRRPKSEPAKRTPTLEAALLAAKQTQHAYIAARDASNKADQELGTATDTAREAEETLRNARAAKDKAQRELMEALAAEPEETP